MAQAQSSPTKRTHCPNCDAKLPEQPLSLCSYCAMPLDLVGGVDKQETKNSARIEKVRSGKGFEEALAAEPPEAGLWTRGWRLGYQGKTLLALAVPSFGLALLFGSGMVALRFGAIVAYVFIAFGCMKIVKGAEMRKRATAAKILRRPALILDRRSETSVRGWTGDTRYYFSLEFEDGGIGEFGMDGRGTGEEPYTSGLFGVACTRGEELLSFKQIRV